MTPSLAWTGCCALAKKDGVIPVSTAPNGVYDRRVGLWRVVFNGTGEAKDRAENHPELPPFAVYVEYNGWPAGIIDPRGGILAAGMAANEDSFIADIEADLGSSIESALSAD